MKKILVPTDGSDLSGYALSLAEKPAKQSGAEICTLRVMPTPAEAVFNHKGELPEGKDFDIATVEKEQELARTNLAGWIDQSMVPAIPVVRAGNLTDQILHWVKREEIDRVIMITTRYQPLRFNKQNSIN